MKKILLIAATAIALLLPLAVKTQAIYAVDINSGSGNVSSICNQPGAASSPYCQDTTSPTNRIYGKDGAIVIASYIIASIAGVAAVIMIVIGGIRFMVSGGDPNSVASARSSIIFAIVGLIIIAAAESIFLFVINNI